MTPAQRRRYHAQLWPAACAAQGWTPGDADRRREVTFYATGSNSSTALKEHEITALFLYLRHLAAPDDHNLAREWETCHADPQKYNRLKQAEHWRKKAGYKHGGKLDRERFGTHFNEEVAAEHMSEKEVADYLMTQRARAQRRHKTRPSEKPTPRRSRLGPQNPAQTPRPAVADCPF